MGVWKFLSGGHRIQTRVFFYYCFQILMLLNYYSVASCTVTCLINIYWQNYLNKINKNKFIIYKAKPTNIYLNIRPHLPFNLSLGFPAVPPYCLALGRCSSEQNDYVNSPKPLRKMFSWEYVFSYYSKNSNKQE